MPIFSKDLLGLLLFVGFSFFGCVQNEKILKQNQAELVNLKYTVSELDKKHRVLELFVGNLSNKLADVGNTSIPGQSSLVELSGKEKENNDKISKNSMKINSLEFEISQLKNEVAAKKEELSNINLRLSRLTKKIVRVPASLQKKESREKIVKKKSKAAKKPKRDVPISLYHDAMTLMEVGNFNESIKEFLEFEKRYPKSTLADNAYYWVGECYYALKEYQKALVSFQKVLDGSFVDKNKAPDAMLKKGFSLSKLAKHNEALLTLKRLIDTYENNPDYQYVVGRARIKVSELKTIVR